MKVLFLAYYFPPESSSGSFRPLFFANHLLKMGCDVQVVTAQADDFLAEQPLDVSLLKKLNPRIIVNRSRVLRPREALIRLRDRLFRKTNLEPSLFSSIGEDTHSVTSGWFQTLKNTVTDLLATPDPQVGWVWSCVRVGKSIIQKGEVDIIWATGSPWSGLVAGALLKKITGKPLVLDFRDPWVSNPNFSRRGVIVQFFDRLLEKFVVKNADMIVANTQELKEDFQQRYCALPNLKVTSITNGFEEYFSSVSQRSVGPLTITHTGALYFSRNPVELLEAAYNLIESGAIKSADLRLQFVGGIEIADHRIKHFLNHSSLENVVKIVPRVSYSEVQQYVSESDVLLLIQPDFPLQVPRKLYEYMAARKPMLCISESNGATAGLMTRFGLGYLCENRVENIERALLQLHRDWQNKQLADFRDSRCDDCLNENLAVSLYQILLSIKDTPPLCEPTFQ